MITRDLLYICVYVCVLDSGDQMTFFIPLKTIGLYCISIYYNDFLKIQNEFIFITMSILSNHTFNKV